jgi:hypothetical protein
MLAWRRRVRVRRDAAAYRHVWLLAVAETALAKAEASVGKTDAGSSAWTARPPSWSGRRSAGTKRKCTASDEILLKHNPADTAAAAQSFAGRDSDRAVAEGLQLRAAHEAWQLAKTPSSIRDV